jgi:hypothetical protein
MRALLPMQCDLMSVAVMLSREHLPTTHCAGECFSRLDLVRLHVHLACVWAR